MMKNIRASLVGFLLIGVVGLFGACGGPEVAPQPGGTLTTANNGQTWNMAAFGTNFWTFTATKTGHTISVTGVGSDFTWDLFDAGFSFWLSSCDNFPLFPGNEICPTGAILSIGTDYGLVVDEWDTVAGPYTLTVDF